MSMIPKGITPSSLRTLAAELEKLEAMRAYTALGADPSAVRVSWDSAAGRHGYEHLAAGVSEATSDRFPELRAEAIRLQQQRVDSLLAGAREAFGAPPPAPAVEAATVFPEERIVVFDTAPMPGPISVPQVDGRAGDSHCGGNCGACSCGGGS